MKLMSHSHGDGEDCLRQAGPREFSAGRTTYGLSKRAHKARLTEGSLPSRFVGVCDLDALQTLYRLLRYTYALGDDATRAQNKHGNPARDATPCAAREHDALWSKGGATCRD